MKIKLPGNARFAFSVFDDTDVATLEYIRPIYDFFASIEMPLTKTVWSCGYSGECNDTGAHSLENKAYAHYLIELYKAGFEIASHGARMVSSTRDITLSGFSEYQRNFGSFPSIYAAHSHNRDNLYWGEERFRNPFCKRLYRKFGNEEAGYYLGHHPVSEFFWGDLAIEHIRYVRNFTFGSLQMLPKLPAMVYSTKNTPFVKAWFCSADADNVEEFNRLLSEHNQDYMEKQGGIFIVSTHFGKGFLKEGKLHPVTEHLMRNLRKRNGFFAPVGTLLNCICSNQIPSLSFTKQTYLELLWFYDTWKRNRYRLHYEKTEIPYLTGYH